MHSGDKMKIRYLGHAAFEVLLDGKKILVDPWITGNPKSPVKLEGMSADIVIVTHEHGDHGFDDAVEIAKKGAKFVGIFELATKAGEKGAKDAVGMNIGGPADIDGLKIVLTQAFHSSTANPTGVVVIGKGGSFYHAGDTGLFGDMKLIGEIYHPEVAMLPIGSHFTMGPVEASYAVKFIKPKIAIPMHYGTFPVLTGTPEEFMEEVKKRAPETEVIPMKPGESVEV